jgi:hypothetical protein
MAIVINGSGTVTGISVGGLPDGIVDAGTLATNSVDSAELIDGSIDAGHLASGVGGKILQYIQVTSTTQYNPGLSYGVVTDSTIAITPSSSSNFILVMYQTGGLIEEIQNLGIKIKRDTTVIKHHDRYGYNEDTAWTPCPVTVFVVDQPSSTSELSYTLEMYKELNHGCQMNDTGTVAGFVGIVMEIAG